MIAPREIREPVDLPDPDRQDRGDADQVLLSDAGLEEREVERVQLAGLVDPLPAGGEESGRDRDEGPFASLGATWHEGRGAVSRLNLSVENGPPGPVRSADVARRPANYTMMA